jgi:hypothetical protein
MYNPWSRVCIFYEEQHILGRTTYFQEEQHIFRKNNISLGTTYFLRRKSRF